MGRITSNSWLALGGDVDHDVAADFIFKEFKGNTEM